MRAVLPQYLWPETEEWTRRLYAETRDRLRAAGVDAPDAIGGTGTTVLTQVCNLPWRRMQRARLNAAGCWDSGFTDLAPGFYRSAIVAHRDGDTDLSAPFAVNGWDSHSGWGAAWGWAEARGERIAAPYRSGAHRQSARDVASGKAGMASIDVISLELLRRHEPATFEALRIVDHTAASPGQTFATEGNAGVLRNALNGAIEAIGADGREALILRGCVEVSEASYEGLPNPPAAREMEDDASPRP